VAILAMDLGAPSVVLASGTSLDEELSDLRSWIGIPSVGESPGFFGA